MSYKPHWQDVKWWLDKIETATINEDSGVCNVYFVYTPPEWDKDYHVDVYIMEDGAKVDKHHYSGMLPRSKRALKAAACLIIGMNRNS